MNWSKGEALQREKLYKLKAGIKHKVVCSIPARSLGLLLTLLSLQDIFSRPDRRLVKEGVLYVREREDETSPNLGTLKTKKLAASVIRGIGGFKEMVPSCLMRVGRVLTLNE